MSGSILPTITHVGAQPLYGSGGGGGGGSNFDNITVSSITFNPSAIPPLTFANNINRLIGLTWSFSGGNSQPQIILDPSGNQPAGPNGPIAGAPNIQFEEGSYLQEDLNGQWFNIVGPNANGDVTISSIICSTINGAPPGVPQNLNLNSITFGGASNPSLLMENRFIQFNDGGSVAAIGSAGVGWNAGASNLNVVAPSTTSVFVGTRKLVGGLSVNDDGVFGGPFISTPNLQVSSINGAVYPPGATVTSVALSNFSGDQAVIPINNVAYPLSLNFNITSGHTYRISANLGFNSIDGTGTRTDIVVSGGGAGFPVFITTKSNTDLIPGLSGQSGGYSTVFLASANATVQVLGYNTSTTAGTTVQVQSASAKWVLEDLGTI